MGNIKIEIELEEEKIRSILCTAGVGSAYWSESRLEYESCVNKIMLGQSVEVIEYDDSTANKTTHILNLDKVKKGFEVMAKDYTKHFSDFITENEDATTGDVFLQCCLFGEVIYG